jgi:aminopeptidase N
VRDLLGDSLFTQALHHYIKLWHGKHPMPYDFFNCMNTGSGVNLNWFWKKWFFDNGKPDQAISSVDINKNQYKITITNIGIKPVPIDLTIFYSDGTTQQIHKSVACWKDGNKTVILHLAAKTIVNKLVLGNGYDADINKDDNVWTPQ